MPTEPCTGKDGVRTVIIWGYKRSYPGAGLAGTALVSTVIFSPLIGITSQTDAKGSTLSCEYDAFNRLARIRDLDTEPKRERTKRSALKG